jgi:hypothetical protein
MYVTIITLEIKYYARKRTYHKILVLLNQVLHRTCMGPTCLMSHFVNKDTIIAHPQSKSSFQQQCQSLFPDNTGYYARHIFKAFQHLETKLKLHGFSPQVNDTDRATAACRRT